MGYPRPKPDRLAEKLLAIRKHLKLSQTEITRQLDLPRHALVSAYELSVREPNLMHLLRYARLANVSLESLIDDKMNLRFAEHDGRARK